MKKFTQDRHFEIEEFLKVARYDRSTGKFFWLEAFGRGLIGAEAGRTAPNGYKYARYRNREVGAHRVAFYVIYGRWPNGEVDHIDGNPSNNSPENIRECTTSENQQNVTPWFVGASGYPGVSLDPSTGKWCARIRLNKKRIILGYFVDPSDAYAAYRAGKAKYHLFSPNGRDFPPVILPQPRAGQGQG